MNNKLKKLLVVSIGISGTLFASSNNTHEDINNPASDHVPSLVREFNNVPIAPDDVTNIDARLAPTATQLIELETKIAEAYKIYSNKQANLSILRTQQENPETQITEAEIALSNQSSLLAQLQNQRSALQAQQAQSTTDIDALLAAIFGSGR